MKRLFLAVAVMLTLATNAQAQQMTIINHTSCEWFITPYMENQTGTPTYPVLYGNTFATLIGPSTYNYVAASATWKDQITGLVDNYNPATWIWSHVEVWPAPCFPLPPTGPKYTVSGSDGGRFSAASSTFPSSVGMTTCCGDNTITWTDLGAGNVQIDIW